MGTKRATSIAQPSDRDFEVTFADLAHAQLRDKAPALLDYLLGFQVIDQNEDQTHAVGVLGFKIGEQMVFVPSFFLNGELKQCLIYIKNQDMFVPLQDNWVTYLLNRRPFIMGESEPNRESDLGVIGPDLSRLSNAQTGGNMSALFGTRQASWNRESKRWAGAWDKLDTEKVALHVRRGVDAMFAKLGDRYASLDDLPSFLKKTAAYGTPLILARTMRRDMDLANRILKFHKMSELLHQPTHKDKDEKLRRRRSRNYLLQRAKSSPPASKSGAAREFIPARQQSILLDPLKDSAPSRVRVLFGKQAADRALIDADRERLLRGEFVIKDAREVANVAYRADSGTKLDNPTENGKYDLLLSDGEFKEVFIFIGPRAIGKGYVRVALVVDKSSGNFGYFWPEELFVRPYKATKGDEERKAIDDLSSVDSVQVGKTYVIVTNSGQASTAFKVVNRKSGKLTELLVKPIMNSPGNKPHFTTRGYSSEDATQFGDGPTMPYVGDTEKNTGRSRDDNDDDKSSDSQHPFTQLNHIVITDDKRQMRVVSHTMFVSSDSKVISLNEGDGLNTWVMNDPSSLIDVEANLLKEGAVGLNMLRKGSSYYVENEGPFSRAQVVTALVKKSGLRGDDAIALVDGIRDDKRARFLIKNNIGFTPPFPDPVYGYDEYSGVPEGYPQEDVLPVDMGLDPNPQGYLGKPERHQIMNAAETGQKDIFDTSAIASLVRTSDSQDLITQYLSDIILGLDRVNRILFMYYWLNEQFRDRYGQENLVELEDQLKNVSKSLGDLVLFLKQRQVEGSPSFDSLEIDMGRK